MVPATLGGGWSMLSLDAVGQGAVGDLPAAVAERGGVRADGIAADGAAVEAMRDGYFDMVMIALDRRVQQVRGRGQRAEHVGEHGVDAVRDGGRTGIVDRGEGRAGRQPVPGAGRGRGLGRAAGPAPRSRSRRRRGTGAGRGR